MKKRRYTGDWEQDFEHEAIMPELVAETIARRHYRDADPLDLGKYLIARFAGVYGANKRWAQKLFAVGNAGRDHLYAFMEHWSEAYVLFGKDRAWKRIGREASA